MYFFLNFFLRILKRFLSFTSYSYSFLPTDSGKLKLFPFICKLIENIGQKYDKINVKCYDKNKCDLLRIS